MQLTGIHHLTAITARASANHHFYTQVLGLRLVKKTVNQDDVSAYHLFYGDGQASPGSDITFFDWAVPPEVRGTGCVVRTQLRVASLETLQWWTQRLKAEPQERDGRWCLDFEDPEGQRLGLVVDEDPGVSHPWDLSPVAPEHQILGLGPIHLSVPSLERSAHTLTTVLNMRLDRSYGDTQVFVMGTGGAAAELHLRAEPQAGRARSGAGGVHHVAFRTPNEQEYLGWVERLSELGIANSGPVDRYYFRSLYFREPGGILYEIATDGPGFDVDEPLESLGQGLALPPFLESRRAEIEAGLKPL